MNNLTLGSLFDGSGGFPLGGKLAGIETLWASEIEPFPIAVTRKRFPNVKHYGDVSKINGAEVEPVDIITFGSPCFPAGTLVVTEKGEIPIEHVSIGMLVITHNGRFRRVIATGAKEADTIILRDEYDHTLECTPNHPIYSTENPKDIGICETGREWIPAKDMLGKFWSRPLQNENHTYFKEHKWFMVSSVSLGYKNTIVYNLTVEEDNSYVADGVVVHNCQDLSLAGKRQGLVDGDRSSLFFQAIRIIKEMRNATNGLDNRPTSPRFIVWENVFGAFSSNKGEDFRKVLEEVCKVKDESVSIPRPKKWNCAGCIMADGYSVAWRLFDAQYWGVPQRRRRIYLVADFDGECAGDILFKTEGLQGDFEEGFRERKETARHSTKSIRATGFDVDRECLTNTSSSVNTPKTLKIRCGCEGGGKGALIQDNISATLGTNNDQTLFQPIAFGICSKESNSMKSDNPNSGFYKADTSRTIDLNWANPSCNQGGIAVVEKKDKNPVLTSSGLSFFTEVSEGVAYTLASRDYKDPPICCSHEEHYIVRRLTPTECARLQGFYDWWCDDIAIHNPTEEDMEFWRNVFETHRKIVSSTSRPKSDRQIKKWLSNPHSDSAEYKMWGNGVALPNVYYVLSGISRILSEQTN